jgi:hypothetical protein
MQKSTACINSLHQQPASTACINILHQHPASTSCINILHQQVAMGYIDQQSYREALDACLQNRNYFYRLLQTPGTSLNTESRSSRASGASSGTSA